jgi:hypothetical protein
VSQGALGTIGAVIGVLLGLGFYLLFKVASGGGFTGFPPLLGIALVVMAAPSVRMPTGPGPRSSSPASSAGTYPALTS